VGRTVTRPAGGTPAVASEVAATYSLTRRVLTAVATASVAVALGASAYLTTTSPSSDAAPGGHQLGQATGHPSA
jgi:hypothetical protein